MLEFTEKTRDKKKKKKDKKKNKKDKKKDKKRKNKKKDKEREKDRDRFPYGGDSLDTGYGTNDYTGVDTNTYPGEYPALCLDRWLVKQYLLVIYLKQKSNLNILQMKQNIKCYIRHIYFML